MDAEEAIRAARADLAALPNRDVEALRRIRKKVSKRLAPLPAGIVCEVARATWTDGPRWVAYELIAAHDRALASLTRKDVEAFGAGMADWAEVDAFAVTLAGAAWREGVLSDADVMRWAKSSDLWWRRAALAATVTLNTKSRGGEGDAVRTLAVCERLADDDEDMVVKALSWALRALAPWDGEAVAAFLARHDEELAARVKREVCNKLKTGLKAGRKSERRRARGGGKGARRRKSQ